MGKTRNLFRRMARRVAKIIEEQLLATTRLAEHLGEERDRRSMLERRAALLKARASRRYTFRVNCRKKKRKSSQERRLQEAESQLRCAQRQLAQCHRGLRFGHEGSGRSASRVASHVGVATARQQLSP